MIIGLSHWFVAVLLPPLPLRPPPLPLPLPCASSRSGSSLLLPLRFAVEELVGVAAVDLYRLSNLALHRLLEGPDNLEVEDSRVSCPLWVLLS